MTPQLAVRRKPATLASLSEGCVATLQSHEALLVRAWRCIEAKGRVRALLKIAVVRYSTAYDPYQTAGHQPRSSWRYFLAYCWSLSDGQKLEAYDRTGAVHAEVTAIPDISGTRKTVMLFVDLLGRCCSPAQETRPVAMLHHIELPIHYYGQESTGLNAHVTETGADAGHRVIAVHSQLLTALVSGGPHHRRYEGDPIVLLDLGHAASRLPGIMTNTALEVPGVLELSVFNTTEDADLAILLEDLAQDSADDICPSADQAVRRRVALASRGLRTSAGAEELAILPQDLAQGRAGLFRPAATLLMRPVPLHRLPSPTSEKTRKNLCTGGWLLARLPLVSHAF